MHAGWSTMNNSYVAMMIELPILHLLMVLLKFSYFWNLHILKQFPESSLCVLLILKFDFQVATCPFFFSVLSPNWMIKVCCRSGQRCASPLRSFILSALYTESTYHDVLGRDVSCNESIGIKQFWFMVAYTPIVSLQEHTGKMQCLKPF